MLKAVLILHGVNHFARFRARRHTHKHSVQSVMNKSRQISRISTEGKWTAFNVN
jgi:hypothetical protein